MVEPDRSDLGVRVAGTRRRVGWFTFGAVVALAGTAAFALMLGVPRLGPGEVVQAMFDPDAPRLARIGVLQIRAPRLVLGLVAGASLAVAGGMLQTGLRNPLAGPELLGVSAGAALIVALVTVGAVGVPLAARPALAAIGGAAMGIIVLALARGGRDPVRTILLGACATALCNAAALVVLALGSSSDVQLFQRFLLGSLTNRTWPQVTAVVPWLVAGLVSAAILRRPLATLRLGDDVAAGVGVPVAAVRAAAMAIAALLTATVVAVCGQVAFVALLAPHLVRATLRTADDRLVLPASAATGAALLAVADLIAREAFRPGEAPVGALTTIVGGAALLVILTRVRRAAW